MHAELTLSIESELCVCCFFQHNFKKGVLYSLCVKADDVSSSSLMVAADDGTLRDLMSGEWSETKRISRISSWWMCSLERSIQEEFSFYSFTVYQTFFDFLDYFQH